MHQNVYIIVDALFILARKKQNGEKDFLVRLAHTISSYLLKGEAFLERNKEKQAPEFMRETVLPILESLALEARDRRQLLHFFAARLHDAHGFRFEAESSFDWSEVDLSAALGKKLLREARAMSS